MRGLRLLLIALLLAGCASVEVREEPKALLADAAFAPPSQPVDADAIFELSPAMRAYADGELAALIKRRGIQKGLVEALNDRGELRLTYDSGGTRGAADTFDGRSGNCLSLVIMTAAFAKAIGLTVRYQSVEIEETWSRNGGMYFNIGHVNITLGRAATSLRFGQLENIRDTTIDFLPPNELQGQRSIDIPEQRIVAMYFNNRAGEALAGGAVNDAYWWVRAAILADPTFLAPYNTLGVVYRRHGNLMPAETALRTVLKYQPQNRLALSNLAIVLSDEGRGTEAQAIRATLAKIDPTPPFYWFEQGMAALEDGNAQRARELFQKEVDRAGDYHEFHFWLGVAFARLGRLDDARREMRLAIENSTGREDLALYTAKLEKLQAGARAR
jgi:Flp pilus assembly protein TadD